MSTLPPARGADRLFRGSLAAATALYVALIVALLGAIALYASPSAVGAALGRPEIRHAFALSFASSTASALLSLWFAVPIGYLLSRSDFRGKALVDALLDVPILLPPMVIGIALLILFNAPLGARLGELTGLPFPRRLDDVLPITFEVPSILLAQFAVACAFAVRTMRVTFDAIDARRERVALTLGCTRAQAFWTVVLPEAGRGCLAAGLLAFARSLGEFGPVLVFSGATRGKTEVLPSTVFLELSIGDLEAAAAVSLLLVAAALGVLLLARAFGLKRVTA